MCSLGDVLVVFAPWMKLSIDTAENLICPGPSNLSPGPRWVVGDLLCICALPTLDAYSDDGGNKNRRDRCPTLLASRRRVIMLFSRSRGRPENFSPLRRAVTKVDWVLGSARRSFIACVSLYDEPVERQAGLDVKIWLHCAIPSTLRHIVMFLNFYFFYFVAKVELIDLVWACAVDYILYME